MIDPAPRTPAFMLDEHRARYVFWILTERDRGDHACLRCYPHGEMARADFLCLRHELEDYFITLRASVRPQPQEAEQETRSVWPGRSTSDPRDHHIVDSNKMMTDTSPSPALSVRQPCAKYLDIWRVGNEWLKIPEGAVCPRCGFLKEEHATPSSARHVSPSQRVVMAGYAQRDCGVPQENPAEAYLAAALEALTIARERIQASFTNYGMLYQDTVTANVIDQLLSSLSGAPEHGHAARMAVSESAPAPEKETVSREPQEAGSSASSRVETRQTETEPPALTPFDPERFQREADLFRRLGLTSCADLFDSALDEITRLEQDLTALHAEIRAQDAEVTRLQQENKALREPVEPQLRASAADPRGRQGSGL